MARDQNAPTHTGLAHHYAHIAVALNETRKGSPAGEANVALDKTIKGVCELIDSFVSQEHKEMAKSGVQHS